MIKKYIFVLVMFFAFFVAGCKETENANNIQNSEGEYGTLDKSNIQNDFELLRTKTGYQTALNEIQKSAIFNGATSDTAQFIKEHGQRIVNWTGDITHIATSHGGDEVWTEIVSSNGVSYRMHDIPDYSPIYRQLSSLREGQTVLFTGVIQQSGSGKWERSFTESGSLKNPEFKIEFENIIALKHGEIISPRMENVREINKKKALMDGEAVNTVSPEVGAYEAVGETLTRDGKIKNDASGKQTSDDVIENSITVEDPGIDCSRAKSHVENLICTAPELVVADSDMTSAYRAAFRRSKNKNDLADFQDSWIKFNRDRCQDVECLILSYRERMNSLQEIQ
ncbi:lysozyme inhibitor LprI family protein [Janthinobacterium sp. MDB2-8]|uniref:lysozyme inhibitor LprI family protein n=1 Tax=Janthinobacterium sp. MDB2-8 TaxID=1259338 RepID=UPI003F1F8114